MMPRPRHSPVTPITLMVLMAALAPCDATAQPTYPPAPASPAPGFSSLVDDGVTYGSNGVNAPASVPASGAYQGYQGSVDATMTPITPPVITPPRSVTPAPANPPARTNPATNPYASATPSAYASSPPPAGASYANGNAAYASTGYASTGNASTQYASPSGPGGWGTQTSAGSGQGGITADGGISGGGNGGGGRGRGGQAVTVVPYIEAGQVATWQFSPGNDAVTYSELAAGVDANINATSTKGTVSVRYERDFGWGSQPNGDSVTGVAQMATTLVPGALTLDYGGYAARAYVGPGGGAIPNAFGTIASTDQLWSVYGGPVLSTMVGRANLAAHYYVGYTDSGEPQGSNGILGASGHFHTLAQDAAASLGFKPGVVLPIGFGVAGGYNQQDISLLDQRITDWHGQGGVIVPAGDTLQLMGDVGYEQVKVSSRDALFDANGNLVLDAYGNAEVDPTSPRQLAYDSSGIIWDVGLTWRPSPRTNLTAYYGKRQGSDGFWGSFAWRPNPRNSFSVNVYDDLASFGGSLTDALSGQPQQFNPVRDAITSNIVSCAPAQTGHQPCPLAVLSAILPYTYRDRGVSANYDHKFGHVDAGLALGYDEREFLAAPDSPFATINGLTDRTWWLSGYASDQLGRHGSLQGVVDVYRFQSGQPQSGASLRGDVTAFSAVGSYQWQFSRHLSASASLAVDGISQATLDDIWTASGALKMRYSF